MATPTDAPYKQRQRDSKASKAGESVWFRQLGTFTKDDEPIEPLAVEPDQGDEPGGR